MALLLGKLDPVYPDGVSYLEEYETGQALQPPVDIVVPPVPQWGMLGNDIYGCCVISGAGHSDMAWNVEAKENDAVPNTDGVVKEYMLLTGGRDTGLVESYALNAWQKHGMFGYKIDAFAPVPHTEILSVKRAIAFYGVCFMGVQLPQSAQQQFVQGGKSIWSVVPGSPVEGGHCVVAVGYDENGVYIVSWGQVVLCTYEWIAKYLDEAYAIIPKQFDQAGGGPALNLKALKADLKRL